MARERRRLTTKKLLIASVGVASITYALGCEKQYPTGNLMPPRDVRPMPQDAGADAATATADAGPLGGDPITGKLPEKIAIATSGNLMPPEPLDAGPILLKSKATDAAAPKRDATKK